MVNILIMEDQSHKADEIKRILIEECAIRPQDIDSVNNISMGRKCLLEKYYDLLILDLVMPLYEDEELDRQEAPNFIDEINTNPNIKQPNQIIGITAYDQEFAQLKEKYEGKLWYLIKYSPTDVDWKKQIKNKVFYLIRVKKNLEESIRSVNKFDIGIVCALQEEFDAMTEAFKPSKWSIEHIDGINTIIKSTTVRTAFNANYKICATCVGRPGMVSTSVLATKLFDICGVDKIFMTGIAAGFSSAGLNLNDIVVAKSIIDYSAGKLIDYEEDGNVEKRLLKENQMMNADQALLSFASQVSGDIDMMNDINKKQVKNHLNGDTPSKAYVVPTACGPYVVASRKQIEEIKESDRKLAALDMEGYGLYFAAYQCGKKALWIKGISDFADSKKNDSYHQKASYASACFLYQLIKETM